MLRWTCLPLRQQHVANGLALVLLTACLSGLMLCRAPQALQGRMAAPAPPEAPALASQVRPPYLHEMANTGISLICQTVASTEGTCSISTDMNHARISSSFSRRRFVWSDAGKGTQRGERGLFLFRYVWLLPASRLHQCQSHHIWDIG